MSDLQNYTARELVSKHACLMDDIEKLPPGTEVSPRKKKELVALEKDLQRRLHSLLIGNVLPIRPMIAEISSKPKAMEKKTEGPLISFHFEAFSAFNTLIKCFKIDATSKKEAWQKARKKTKDYPGQVNLKVS